MSHEMKLNKKGARIGGAVLPVPLPQPSKDSANTLQALLTREDGKVLVSNCMRSEFFLNSFLIEWYQLKAQAMISNRNVELPIDPHLVRGSLEVPSTKKTPKHLLKHLGDFGSVPHPSPLLL